MSQVSPKFSNCTLRRQSEPETLQMSTGCDSSKGGVENTIIIDKQTSNQAPSEKCLKDGLKTGKSIRVKLVSSSEQQDNKAEVEVMCKNPDDVVDRMLKGIVEKFPPTSFVTVQKGNVPTLCNPETRQKIKQYSAYENPLHKYATNGVPGKPLYSYYSGYGPAVHYSMPPLLFQQNPVHHFTNPFAANLTSNVHVKDESGVYTTGQTVTMVNGMSKCQSKETDNLTVAGEGIMHTSKVEIIKEVPKIHVEWTDKLVEVPQVQYVDKYEEVERVHEVTKHVPKVEVIEVPYEVLKYVPKKETKYIEKVVEVPKGPKVPVPRLYPVNVSIVVPKFVEREVPVIMSHVVSTEIEESDEVVEVEVAKYIPKLVPVDVYVPKPIAVPIKSSGMTEKKVPLKINPEDVKKHEAILQRAMLEMNPHLQQLDSFNFSQNEKFKFIVAQSADFAKQYGFLPPQPIYANLFPSENGGKLQIGESSKSETVSVENSSVYNKDENNSIDKMSEAGSLAERKASGRTYESYVQNERSKSLNKMQPNKGIFMPVGPTMTTYNTIAKKRIFRNVQNHPSLNGIYNIGSNGCSVQNSKRESMCSSRKSSVASNEKKNGVFNFKNNFGFMNLLSNGSNNSAKPNLSARLVSAEN